MKFGVVVCQETKNIGDDIQSYAAAKLLPQVDYLVEREKIALFRSDNSEPVATILNGWFMDNKTAWPVSPDIIPLYTSFHFRRQDPLHIEDLIFRDFGGSSMRKYGPVGCRDESTRSVLEKNGIEAYFSGCVTLTLKPEFPRTAGGYVILSDVPADIETALRNAYPNITFKQIHQTGEDGVQEGTDWERRFNNTEALLTLYQNADAVVTTRLHCALPCLALRTPVLLLTDDSIAENDRFEGLLPLVNHKSFAQMAGDVTAYDLSAPPQNSDAYLKLAAAIRESLEAFVNNVLLMEKNNALEKQNSAEWMEQRAHWLNELLKELDTRAVADWVRQHEAFEEMERGRVWLNDTLAEKENALQELQRRYNELEKHCAETNAWREKPLIRPLLALKKKLFST